MLLLKGVIKMMFDRIKCRLFLMSLLISMISGFIAGSVVACVENRADIAKKCKKAFRQLEDKMT